MTRRGYLCLSLALALPIMILGGLIFSSPLGRSILLAVAMLIVTAVNLLGRNAKG